MNHLSQKIILLLLTLSVGMITTVVKSETENIEKSFKVKSGGTLDIKSDQGSIKVETWNKKKVEILVKKKARNKDRLKGFKVKFEQKGNQILVDGDGERNNRVSLKYIVKVPKEFNLDLNTGGGSITVDDISGEIKVDTSGGSISIGDVIKGAVDADTSGGSIKVGNVGGNLKVNTSGGSISLGKVSGTSSIDTSGGSISLESGGNDVEAETSGGSINIGPVKGKVDVDTSGGSITIEMADEVKANTSGGSISIEGSKGSVDIDSSGGSLFVGSSGGPVKAETSGGNIKILQAKGFIEADTSGGKIEAEMILADKSADTHVTLESSGGSITLYISKSLAASVSATLEITRNARRDYRIYSDFPLTIKGDNNSDKITAKGDINGGGDKIRIDTTNGDIHIKMLSE